MVAWDKSGDRFKGYNNGTGKSFELVWSLF